MTTETMTLREALSEKKLIEKKIQFSLDEKIIHVTTHGSKIIDGLSTDEWADKVKSNYQSLTDNMRRYNALSKAILNANVNHRITVKKFKGFESTNETEEISFAEAIARKNFFKIILMPYIETQLAEITRASRKYETECQKAISLVAEETNKACATKDTMSSRNRESIEENFKKIFEVTYHDPLKAAKLMAAAKDQVESYLNSIDASLGHLTEVTDVTIEY